MKRLLYIPVLYLMIYMFVTSCDDDVTNTGSSLITDKSEIIIDSSFTITGSAVAVNAVQSRTLTQLIGRLDAKGFGTLSSEIVTQFMPSLNLDTLGTSADDILSMDLIMFFTSGNFTGDSLAPLGLQVYPLTKQLPSPIYSNFDPTGYYNPNTMWESQVYTGNAIYSDSLQALNYRTIRVSLPLEFAKRFYNEYLTSPQTFNTPTAFAQFFPGIYIKNSFGEGRVTNINETRINMRYVRHSSFMRDSVKVDTSYTFSKTYMSVTPEVISNNIIRYNMADNLRSMVDAGQTILVAPIGMNVEMRFPLPEIVAFYKQNAGNLAVVNSLTLSIPAEEITNNYGIDVPNNILFVLKKDFNEFFAKNKLADDKTSFLATYNAATKRYELLGMRQYLLDMLAKESLSIDDFTFLITPVDVETEEVEASYYQSASVYITAIRPYVSRPTMVNLKLDKAKVYLTFGKQSAIF